MRSELRRIILSGSSAVVAPLVFLGIIVLRKVHHRVGVQTRFWNRRLQHEISRWT
jgi:hypothetical protein